MHEEGNSKVEDVLFERDVLQAGFDVTASKLLNALNSV